MSLFKYFNTSCIPFKVSPIYPKSFCCLQEDCTFTSPVSNNTTQFFKGFFNFLVFIYPKVTRQLRGNDDMNVLQASLAALRCKSLPPRRNRNLRCNAVGRGGIISGPRNIIGLSGMPSVNTVTKAILQAQQIDLGSQPRLLQQQFLLRYQQILTACLMAWKRGLNQRKILLVNAGHTPRMRTSAPVNPRKVRISEYQILQPIFL